MNQVTESPSGEPDSELGHWDDAPVPHFRIPRRALSNSQARDGCLHPLDPNPIEYVKMETVIVIQLNRGTGQVGDPQRLVWQYWSQEGQFLAERDQINEPL